MLSPERPLEDVDAAIKQVLDGSAPAPRLVSRMTSAGAGTAGDERAVASA